MFVCCGLVGFNALVWRNLWWYFMYGGPMPLEVDNTVRESKNQTMMKMMSWMLLQKGLQLTGLMMSRVGHTHSTLGS